VKKWPLDNQLETETVIYLSVSWLYPRNLAFKKLVYLAQYYIDQKKSSLPLFFV